jgi:hypothetical protein
MMAWSKLTNFSMLHAYEVVLITPCKQLKSLIGHVILSSVNMFLLFPLSFDCECKKCKYVTLW